MHKLIPLLTLTLFAQISSAKTWKNNYVSFDLPEKWGCTQEGFAWVCSPKSKKNEKEAVIVMSAKVRAPEDNLENMLHFLSQPKKIDKDGKITFSKISYARKTKINGTEWADALHASSEVRDFMTRYLATTKDDLAMVVSFTVREDVLDKYSEEFMASIRSIHAIKEPSVSSHPEH